MKTLYAIASRFAGPGIGRTASHAALGLWRAGQLHKLLCLGHENTEIPDTLIEDISFPPRGFLRFLPDKPYYEAKNRWFDFLAARDIVNGIDTFHCWNSQVTTALSKAKHFGIRTVLDRASSHIRTQTQILREEYARHGISYEPTYSHVITRCTKEYDLADLVVVPSPFAYRSFVDQGFDMTKVVFNPFGVDLERFSSRPEPPKKFQVAFVGQIGIRKGIFDLLPAWDSLNLKDATLVLAGGIEPSAEPLLAKWRERENIVFAGFVKDVQSLLHQSSAFVFPSCEEGSALVTYEAMACGLPLIVTENAGSVAEDGKSGIMIKRGDTDAIAEGIERLYRNPDLAWEMGKAARVSVEGYPWQAYGDRTAKIHQALAEGQTTQEIQKATGLSAPTST